MKNTMMSVLVALVLSLAATTAHAQWQTVFTVGNGPAQRMIVDNQTPFWCLIHAANHEVAMLAPGHRAEDFRRSQGSAYQTIPVWAQCYREKDPTTYVGFAKSDFTTNIYQPTNDCWVITPDLLRGIDGAPVEVNAPMPATSFGTEKMKVPEKNLSGASFLDIFNNSSYAVLILINGQNKGILTPGLLSLEYVTGGYYGTPLCVEIIPYDNVTKQRLPLKPMQITVPAMPSTSVAANDLSYIIDSHSFPKD